jgi:FAD-dependent urate hydroxylase
VTVSKNARKAAGPVARVVDAWAIKFFAKLSKPEKMSWIFDYRIDWDAKVTGRPGA